MSRLSRFSLAALGLASAVLAEPRLVFQHNPPDKAVAGEPLVLEGSLVAEPGIKLLVVWVRRPGRAYVDVRMDVQYGDLYRVRIPAEQVTPPQLEYYVEAVTARGARLEVFASAANPAKVRVTGTTKPADREQRAPARPDGRGRGAEAQPPDDRGRDTGAQPPGDRGRATEAHPPDDRGRGTDARGPDDRSRGSAVPEADDRGFEASGASPSSSAAAPEPPERQAQPPAEGASGPKHPRRSPEEGAAPPVSPGSRDERPGAQGKPRSELDDELALYAAVDEVALATRQDERVTRVASTSTTFSREQIRALGARSVYDVLDVVPGLSVSRDVQGFYRTAVRGLRADPEVLFLLNGHRLNDFYDGKALANLPVENIERIEVTRGPGSALFGAGAFLATVDIVTTRAPGLRAAVEGGMFETLDGHASGATTLGPLTVSADADLLKQTGYQKPIAADYLEKDTRAQGMRGPLDPVGKTNDNRWLANLGVALSYDAGSQGKLGLSARALYEDRAALIGLFDTVGHDSRLGWTALLAGLTYERKLGDAAKLHARASFDDQTTRRLFQVTPDGFRTGPANGQLFPDGLLESTTAAVRSVGGELGADWALARTNRLSLGAVADEQALYDYSYKANFDATNHATPTLARPDGLVYPNELAKGAAASRLTLGLYAEDQWTVVDPLTLTFGFRAEAVQLPQLDAQNEVVGTALAPSLDPRAAAVVTVSEALVLQLVYGRALRAPTVQELAELVPSTPYDLGRFEGNLALRPATVDTVELGGDLVQSTGQARVRLRAHAFYESFTSPIAPVDTSGNIVPVANRTGVRVLGAEGEARLEASSRATAWLNASWFRAEDQDAPTQLRLLTDTPQARVNAGLSMPLGPYLDFDFVVRVGAERRNDARSVLELVRRWNIPAFALVTAQLRTQLVADHFEAALVGQNLFDQAQVDDVPRPDRVTGLLPREGMSAYLTVRAIY